MASGNITLFIKLVSVYPLSHVDCMLRQLIGSISSMFKCSYPICFKACARIITASYINAVLVCRRNGDNSKCDGGQFRCSIIVSTRNSLTDECSSIVFKRTFDIFWRAVVEIVTLALFVVQHVFDIFELLDRLIRIDDPE